MKKANDIKETRSLDLFTMSTLLKDEMPFGMRTLLKDYVPFGKLKCISYDEAMAALKKKYAEELKEFPFYTATFFLRNAWKPVNDLLQEFTKKHRNKIARTILKTDDAVVIKELAIEISNDIVSVPLYNNARKQIQDRIYLLGLGIFSEETADELEKIDSELNLCDIRLCCVVQTILYNKFMNIINLLKNKNK